MGLSAQDSTLVIHIEDISNLTDEEIEIFYDSRKEAQNHDVEVVRSWLTEGKGYWMEFYTVKDGTLKMHLWGYETDVSYDRLSYYWRGDTCLYRFESSTTEDRLDMEFIPTANGSRNRVTDRH